MSGPPTRREIEMALALQQPQGIRSLALVDFKKPKLPPLRGTPSSRRQYAYGAGVEPTLARLARQGDLNSAVQDTLVRHPGERGSDANERDERSNRRQGSRQPSHPVEEEDELARSEADYRPRRSTTNQRAERNASHSPATADTRRPTPNLRGWTPDGSEFDDARSFDMENDYYGDATIDLSPRPTIPPTSTFRSPLRQQLASKSLQSALAADKSPDNAAAVTTSIRSTHLSVSPPEDTNQRDLRRRRAIREDASRQQENEQQNTPESMQESGIDVNAPALKQARNMLQGLFGSSSGLALASPPESEPQLGPDDEAPTGFQPYRSEQQRLDARLKLLSRNETTQQAISQNISNEDQARDSRRRPKPSSGGSGTGLFSRGPGRTNNADPQIRTDRSEMDDAIQKDIQAAEAEAARQRRAREAAEARREEWRQRWAELKSLSPWHQSRSTNREGLRAFDDDAIDWWELLNPWTYLQALVWFLRSMANRIARTFSSVFTPPVRQRLASFGVAAIYLFAGLLMLIMGFTLSRAAYANFPTGVVMMPRFPTPSWPSFGAISGRIGGFIPSISWPRNPLDGFPRLSDLSDDQQTKLEDSLNKIFRELRLLKKADKLHEASIKKLESIVPELVHMKLKDGKPVVTQQFWHAIRDLIHQDGSFLTLEKKGNTYGVSSERQWKAIAARLAKDPAFTSQLNLDVGKMEDRLSEKLPHAWDTWITNNQRKVSQMIGSALDKMKLTGSKADLDTRLEKIVKEQLGRGNTGGVVVTRDEFLRHLKNEFTTHRAEMRAEISELQPKLERLVRESIQLANDEAPAGMTRKEIAQLVNGLVRKSIADANLEAMAKNRIHDHWDKDLKNQVNYFGVGAGAIVSSLTSPNYKPSKEYLNQKGVKAIKPRPANVALQPWHDDGDCWCASRKINKRGNPYDAYLTVTLGHTIVPQHVVIEHILPGATTDPEARPRDIEVYANFEDPVVRGRVRDFAANHFPDNDTDWNYTPHEFPPTYAKIGQFVYEGAELHDGVQVYRLSNELMALGAETDIVAVRATSNYGAANYTCFYRIRLFGQKVDFSKSGE